MRTVIQEGDDDLIALLSRSEGWKALDRRLEQMELEAFESILHDTTSREVRAVVELIRKIRRLPESLGA